MKSTLKILACAGAAMSFATATQAQFLYTNFDGSATGNPGLSTGATTGSGVAAPAGSEWSEVQAAGGFVNNVAGYGFSAGLRLADNFTVPSGQTWTVNAIRFYAYVTGSAAGINPWTLWTLQITSGNGPANPPALLFDGGADPTPGTTVVFGDTTTNLIGASGPATAVVTDTNLYRIFNTNPGTTPPGTTRLIRQIEITFTPALSLNAGTYWLNIGNNAGFVPAVTIVGQRGKPGADGVQNIPTASVGTPPGVSNVIGWNWLRDGGTALGAPIVVQDIPFVILGTSSGGGCYANCDGSTGTPQLTPADFVCFLNKFRAGDPYANCDGSTGTPALTPADFVCFLNKFRAGC